MIGNFNSISKNLESFAHRLIKSDPKWRHDDVVLCACLAAREWVPRLPGSMLNSNAPDNVGLARSGLPRMTVLASMHLSANEKISA